MACRRVRYSMKICVFLIENFLEYVLAIAEFLPDGLLMLKDKSLQT